MNGFTKKSVGTLTLGEKLKKFRCERRISLNEVSKATRIQIKYLEYLEESDWEKLPADVYVKGFIRSYADFLGLDEMAMLRLWEKERGIKKNLEKKQKKPGKIKPVNVSSFVFTPKKIMIAVCICVILAGFFLLYKEIGNFASAPRLVVISPKDKSEINGNTAYLEGITDKDATLSVNGQPILVGDDGKFGENLTLQSGINVIEVKAVNKFEKAADQTITVKSNYQENNSNNSQNPDASDSTQTDNQNQSQNTNQSPIQIEIKVDPGPVWISVEADGNQVFSGTMLTGAMQAFSANDKIVINSGKGSATFVKFNGKDFGALSGDAGAVRGVVFDKNTKY